MLSTNTPGSRHKLSSKAWFWNHSKNSMLGWPLPLCQSFWHIRSTRVGGVAHLDRTSLHLNKDWMALGHRAMGSHRSPLHWRPPIAHPHMKCQTPQCLCPNLSPITPLTSTIPLYNNRVILANTKLHITSPSRSNIVDAIFVGSNMLNTSSIFLHKNAKGH